MNINLKDRVVKICTCLTDENGVPVGRRYLLNLGWSENKVDMFGFIWGNATLCVGIIILVLIVYD